MMLFHHYLGSRSQKVAQYFLNRCIILSVLGVRYEWLITSLMVALPMSSKFRLGGCVTDLILCCVMSTLTLKTRIQVALFQSTLKNVVCSSRFFLDWLGKSIATWRTLHRLSFQADSTFWGRKTPIDFCYWKLDLYKILFTKSRYWLSRHCPRLLCSFIRID